MSEKILLIDGHSILNRAYYGLPNLTNWEGLHTNAVYGFLNIMTKVLEEEKPEYLAVAFDLHAPTFRHKMYDAYKGTRKPMPEELREQVPLIKEVLTAMGVAIVTKEGYEADDLLGTIAGMAEKKGMDATILSGDRDLLQLATDHVLIRIPKTKGGKTEVEDYHAKEVLETYQVTPPQIIELKALMGDTADNIPGIPGVGEKTATKIIAAYGSIENAHEHLEEIKPNKAKESLRDHYDLAVLSKKLATIDTESPVEFSWEAARMGNLYTPEAYDYFKRLEFKNLLSRFDQQKTEQKELPSWRIVEDFAEAENIWNQAEKSAQTGVAVVDGMEGIRGVAVAMEDQEVVYFPVEGFQTEGVLCGHLERLFAGSSEIGAWDVKSIRKKIEIPERKGIFDLGIGAYLMNPLKSDYTYDDVAKEYLGEQLLSQEEVFSGMKKPEPKKADNEQAAAYGAYQAYVALHGKDALKKALQEAGMWNLFEEIEMPLVFTLDDMEKEGILVKGEELKLYGEKLEVRIRELEEKIYEEAGETFNINSPKQLGVILFEKMQMPGGKKTKTGYSTAADVLDKLAPDYPFVADILEYRQLTKLKSTYADGLAGYIGEDGRIHSTFNQTITATGRISSTEPNLQNIPVRTEIGRQLRKVFVPKEGCVFVDADYSQIELRILAHMSGDANLINAYKHSKDIHAATASLVFGVPIEEVTKTQRSNAKAVNFGIVYGISSFGLSQDLSISKKEAQQYINNYFESYPGIKQFLDNSVNSAKEKGYSVTMFGRKRPIPELKESNFMRRQFGERVAMNAPIQGTAADIMKIAMINVDKALKNNNLVSRIVLQVHDELLIEAKKEEVEQVKDILINEMSQAANLEVPLLVEAEVGNNWDEAH